MERQQHQLQKQICHYKTTLKTDKPSWVNQPKPEEQTPTAEEEDSGRRGTNGETKSHGPPWRLQSKWNHDMSKHSIIQIDFIQAGISETNLHEDHNQHGEHKNTKTQKYYTFMTISNQDGIPDNKTWRFQSRLNPKNTQTNTKTFMQWLIRLHDNQQGLYWTVKSVVSFLTKKGNCGLYTRADHIKGQTPLRGVLRQQLSHEEIKVIQKEIYLAEPWTTKVMWVSVDMSGIKT
jgi:hypothetical protein